jgi:hypothetical protein
MFYRCVKGSLLRTRILAKSRKAFSFKEVMHGKQGWGEMQKNRDHTWDGKRERDY